MNRARTILVSLRLSNFLLSTRISTTRPFLTQVTHFFPCFLSREHSYTSDYVNIHKKLYSSSKPSSLVELLSVNDWSPELETQLENSSPLLTHETVIYVLKKLDKDPHKAWDFFNWVCDRNGFKPSSPLYSLMLRILVKKDSMKNFWITLRKMKEQGFYTDEETYLTILGVFRKERMDSDAVAFKHFFDRMVEENAMDSVVKNVVSVVSATEWSNEVEKELEGMGILLTDNFVIRVLKELRNYPLKALQFFNWAGKCERYECNTITYNAIARVLGRDDSIGEFWNVVEEMKNAGHEMDIDTYIKISRQFQKNKLMGDAVKLYEFMMDGPFKPSVQDCSMLLRSISASNYPDLNLVFRVVNKYEATGNSLSKAVYDGIHRSLTSIGNFDEAAKMMKCMQTAGYEPDNITYSQLVFGLCKARRLEEACEVLDEMEAHGCLPDIKTWTILIQGHCVANEVGKALMCLAKMMEKHCDPDADLLAVLINAFLSQKRIDGAYTLFMDMVDKARLRPWQATYKLLIEKLLEVRKLEEALNLLRLMKQHNHPPFPEPFVQYISRFGTVDDAADFLKALSVKEYPSTSAYLNVFQSFFRAGRHSEAKDLLFKCPHHIRKHPKISELFGSAKTEDATA
ncbi:pentatricopeptide repeat-containing protein At3g48250, chloroplastic [Ricinus communis]|uniref:pentatricopeptide repeat-containing protein At3g48250, chloroplastic n=1 Tax=Ricinus communis TaxID=3988 RepID=UPI00201AD47F|nr:pentatricopeptide repeat-containing protein At3g48250, chloroplastic [Ricinus communis]